MYNNEYGGVVVAGLASNILIRGNHIYNNGGINQGIVYTNIYLQYARNIAISNNTISHSFTDGISLINTVTVFIDRNHIHNNPRNGIYVDEPRFHSSHTEITFNQIEHNRNHGISASAARRVIVKNNTIENNNKTGILIEGVKEIVSAEVTDNIVSGHAQEGVNISRCDNLIVKDNVMNNNGTDCMHSAAAVVF